MMASDDENEDWDMSSDSGEEYVPDFQNFVFPTSGVETSEVLDTPPSVSSPPANTIQVGTNKCKKKIAHPNSWKKNNRKLLRDKGEAYIDTQNNPHSARSIKSYEHTCRYNCNTNISEMVRTTLFNEFWSLASWNLQSSFISSCVKKKKPSRTIENATKAKSLSTIITLQDTRVCKPFFLKTLDISNKRFINVVQKKSNVGVCPPDRRGRHVPKNKLSDEALSFVKSHIESFPKYKSHYSREANPDKRFLNERLTVSKMYELYKEKCNQDGKLPVKESMYRTIFNTRFNLSFHRPHSDTCVTCDRLEHEVSAGNPQAATEKELHQQKAEAARKAKKEAKNLSLENPAHVSICFDLEKTLPTPMLTCSKVYYLRQLWVYNLGIHNMATGEGNMYMWHEAEGSKGSKEIASCLLKFIAALSPSVKHITAFSDNAGGQNKNKNILKFWNYVTRYTQIETVDHKFLVSGHSYMECDQDFGRIEKKRRATSVIYTPDEWVDLVKNTSKKFHVVKMERSDFKNFDFMDNFVKCDVKGMRSISWFHFEKSNPDILLTKNSVSVNIPFTKVNILKKRAGRPPLFPVLPELHKEPLKIKLPKFKNLMELLPFVPPIHHHFFKSLTYEGQHHRIGLSVEPNDEACNEDDGDIESDYD